MVGQFYRNDLPELQRKIKSFGYGVIYDKNDLLQTMLHEYSKRGDSSCVELILETHKTCCKDHDKYAVFIDLKDFYGKTALHYAAESCVPNCINLLLFYSAYKHIKTTEGLLGKFPFEVLGKNAAQTVTCANKYRLEIECIKLLCE